MDPELLFLPTRKPRRSALDPHATELLDMHDKNDSLVSMKEWLEKHNVTSSIRMISKYLKNLREARFEDRLLRRFGTASHQCKRLNAAFRKDPPPDLKTIMNVIQVIVWNINTKEEPSPAELALADKLVNTVLRFADSEKKSRSRARQLNLAEDKAAESKKSERTKAFDLCLEECKDHPEIMKLFKTAFAAIEPSTTTETPGNEKGSDQSQIH